MELSTYLFYSAPPGISTPPRLSARYLYMRQESSRQVLKWCRAGGSRRAVTAVSHAVRGVSRSQQSLMDGSARQLRHQRLNTAVGGVITHTPVPRRCTAGAARSAHPGTMAFTEI